MIELKERLSLLPLLLILFLFVFGCATGISEEEAAGLYFNLGNAYTEMGKDSEAVKAYESARRLDPSLFQAGYNLARLHIDARRFDEGRQLLDVLLKEDPENVILLEAYAWSHYEEGQEEEALKIYGDILDLQYNHTRSLYNSSRIYLHRGDIEKAAVLLYTLWEDGARESGVPDKNTLLLEWIQLQIEAGEDDGAFTALLYLESEDPSTEVYTLLGDFYNKQEKYGLALESYEKAAEGDGASAELHYKLANLLLLVIEDEVKGLEQLTAALNAGYDDRDELKALVEDEKNLFTEEVRAVLEEKGITLEKSTSEEDVAEPEE